MTINPFSARFGIKLCLCLSLTFASIGCAVSAKTEDSLENLSVAAGNSPARVITTEKLTPNSLPKGRIDVKQDSPADAVRDFYAALRDGRFREALLTTNLRPAVEKMSEADLEDFKTDFDALARQVPADIQISGEIVTGDKASVTVKIPNEENGKVEDKVFNLRRENGRWIFLTADARTEAEVKKQGKNYFYALRTEIHHIEAQDMLERIAKAQSVYAMENGGFAEMKTLIDGGLLAEDVQTPESTGYNYKIVLTAENKGYFATAEPAVYAKTGKFSYLLETPAVEQKARLSGKDVKGATLKKG